VQLLVFSFLVEVFIDVVVIWSVVVRDSYLSDLVHPATRVLLGLFFWGYSVAGLLDPDFPSLFGVSSQFMYLYILCGLPASFCVLWELSTQYWVVLKAPT
jgi:hypothetical protein